MDNVKVSLDSLAQLFGSRMAVFEQELKKISPAKAPTVNSLAEEFEKFRLFVFTSLGDIQNQVSLLSGECDSMEMRTRRKMLMLHGVPEKEGEVAVDVTVDAIRRHIGLADFAVADVSRAHRMGRAGEKPRPILVKFRCLDTRNEAWFAKTGFKGTGITLSEFLTRRRHQLFRAARLRLGTSRCWTREGRIIALDSGGKRHNISSQAVLDHLFPPPEEASVLTPSAAGGPKEPVSAAVRRRAPVTSARRVRGQPASKS